MTTSLSDTQTRGPGLESLLDRALEDFAAADTNQQSAGAEDALRRWVVRAPTQDPLCLWPTEQDSLAVFFQDPDGASVGLGEAAQIAETGTERFEEVRRRAEALWGRLSTVNLSRDSAPEARLYGGFAFRSGEPPTDVWAGFGDARFVLPRLAYHNTGGQGWLSLTLSRSETRDPELRAGFKRQWLAALERLAQRASSTAGPQSAAPTHIEDAEPEPWGQEVERAVQGIRDGQFEKVVLARRTEVKFEGRIDERATLTHLGQGYPATQRFAFRFEGRTFLGATPERLIQKRGTSIQSEAVAGSIRAGDSPQVDKLLDNPKERFEHQLVVDAIVSALGPLASDLTFPPSPEVRKLRHLLHLSTPITGTLDTAQHVVELVAKLHPTPAVGGVPTEAALDWIASHEPHPRGWYAAPVGWFDQNGDGLFNVALRSGILKQSRASLYAGAGIVRDSQAENEYAETRLKLASLFHALRSPA